MNNIQESSFNNALRLIKEKVYQAKYNALKIVNTQLLNLYWEIGKIIVQKQESEKWGRSVVEQISKELMAKFPGTSGFSSSNLWYMRELYLLYSKNLILQPLVGEFRGAIILLNFSQK